MYGSVLLIGGGFMFNGAAAMLQSRLQAKLPASHRKLVDQVEVIARPKVSSHSEGFRGMVSAAIYEELD